MAAMEREHFDGCKRAMPLDPVRWAAFPRPFTAFSLPIFTAFPRPFTAFFHCLSSTFHCLFTAIPRPFTACLLPMFHDFSS